MSAMLEYKCRRCGKVEAFHSLQTYSSGYAAVCDEACYLIRHNQPGKIHTHAPCNGSGMGIMDLIGVTTDDAT